MALYGIMAKHLVSVIDLIEGTIEPTEYFINEKLGDLINYLVLLEAVFKEELSQKNLKCVDCGGCSNSEVQ